jgi:polysaccharide deacetylase family protein (PEP-CTERM system associated)
MTVDVEDYFQVSAFEPYIAKSDWENIPCRVERNVDQVLGMFSDAGVKATFFTLGWIAERYPSMIRRIVSEGHELASHGWSHVRVTEQSREAFVQDVGRTKAFLEDLGGKPILGYRAASYSIGERNLWALAALEESGHAYSSSIYPIRHDLYGMPNAPRFAFRPNKEGNLVEFPVTTVRVGSKNYPCGGGGWFRLLPYSVSKWAVQRVNGLDGEAAIFYFHPWEIDPAQPTQHGIDAKTRFRHYLNLSRMQSRLERLLRDFEWGRMDQVLYQPEIHRLYP